MNAKYVPHHSKQPEQKGFGLLFHIFNKQNAALPPIPAFDSFLGLKERIVQPHLGVMPQKHIHRTLIKINLRGTLAQKSKHNGATVLPSQSIQVLDYKEGAHFEYNTSASKNTHSLAFVLASKHTENMQTLLTLNTAQNTLTKVVHHTITNTNKQTCRLYHGVFEKDQTQVHESQTTHNGYIVYLQSGEVAINNQVVLKARDTIALWQQRSLRFTTHKAASFFMLEITC